MQKNSLMRFVSHKNTSDLDNIWISHLCVYIFGNVLMNGQNYRTLNDTLPRGMSPVGTSLESHNKVPIKRSSHVGNAIVIMLFGLLLTLTRL